jgi:hypothetical protein
VPEFSFSLTDGKEDELAKLNKTLNWLMNNLDHDNVRRLYTEYCSIQSENGETVIDGPLIKMTEGTTTLRLKMGKDGSDFVFKLYSAAGVETLVLNSTGSISINGGIVLGGYLSAAGQISSSSIICRGDLYVSGNIDSSGTLIVRSEITSSNIYSHGTLSIDRIQGYSANYLIRLGTGSCNINVGGGDVRLGNDNGAYLIITDYGVTFYDASGTPHTIV